MAFIWNISTFYLYYLITFILSMPGPSIRSLSFKFPHQRPVWVSLLPHAYHMPYNLILLDFMTLICGEENRPCSSSSCNFLQPQYLLLLRSKYLPHHPTLRPSAHVLPLMHHHHHCHYPHHWLYSPGLALPSSSLNEKVAQIKGFLITMMTTEYGTSDMSSFWRLEF